MNIAHDEENANVSIGRFIFSLLLAASAQWGAINTALLLGVHPLVTFVLGVAVFLFTAETVQRWRR